MGTSAQALAAGIPQLTMPMGFDRPDNTARLWRLGVARWVVPSRFTGERVARELAALLDDARTAERCRHWAREITRSDALGETCVTLEFVRSVSTFDAELIGFYPGLTPLRFCAPAGTVRVAAAPECQAGTRDK